ncbi:hypothetical protein [Pseudorhizobium pelagicum]|nr:hypothetical protein [Pseudorhizobium pelagicum]
MTDIKDLGMRDIATTQRNLLLRIHTEGVEAAYEAALAVCKNTQAPAPARATASATLFRVAGYFERKETGPNKQPHEMTADEISEEIAGLRSRFDERNGGIFD